MLCQLVNDVLDFSRIEAGQLELAPQPMLADEAVETVIDLMAAQAFAKGVELRFQVEGAGQWILADPVRLRQAVFNLVGNAVKFTPRGQVVVRLKVEPAAPGCRHVRIEVEDTGVGVAPEAQARLFEGFRQAENSAARRFGGAGLGLIITKALVVLMGGQIGFTTTPGQGSTFWFAFDAAEAEPVEEASGDGAMLDGVRILLVEDNATNRLVARTLLSRLGASVAEAEDGLEGVEAARLGGFDLILMDIQMPNMDGVEAARAIRRLDGVASQVPIIALTANVMTRQRAEYTAVGMNGVIAKPISPAALLGEIERILTDQDQMLAG
jgi:CheY-like chemotaxis protein